MAWTMRWAELGPGNQGAKSPGSSGQRCLHIGEMKVPVAALSVLILAATLGSPAHGSPAHESLDAEPRMVMHQLNPTMHSQVFHLPPDCCWSYTKRKIRCVFMKSYFETTSGCSQPGVIFITKRGRRVCANPYNAEVQDCIMNMQQDSVENLSRSHFIY
ncbi:C-C motif chemokine 15-like isoform X2 [Eptesicus fuscus]|uniref:C-C motif chemokine 15-like isoform X2 n=1 Tax=Eptesicus fuscus TaxID=29078 RepID=UPI0024042419|nr:C-C motif chemokine 15-like isoform X2 [Eptesicus fuscus]